MNMFKPVKATTVEEYLAMLPADRKDIILAVHAFIRKTAPTLTPHFAYNMIGYGSFKYKNYKKDIIDWPVISLANQKKYISLYICAIMHGKYVAEEHAADLGNVSVGKSCIRFKAFSDLNLKTLETVIRIAQKNPGLVAG